MKTETTKRLEELLANHFNKRNDFYVFECTIGWYGKEIVDEIIKLGIAEYKKRQALGGVLSERKNK